MKIALIHCPFGHRVFSENLKVVDEEFCLAPPIVLAYVAAILEKSGHQVMIIDANALKLTKEKALQKLSGFLPDIIGFRADTYWFHRVTEWAGYFKEHLKAKVVIGGINIALYPEESLSYACFDYGISGEANKSFPELLHCLKNNLSPEHIPGLVYRLGGKILANPVSENPIDFDDYPFPARHLLPNHLYGSFTSQRKNFTIILTSTGCPYKCTFCAIHRLPFRQRTFLSIVDEIEQCYRDFGVREIDFFDATFFINKSRDRQICDEMLKRKIKVEWSCRSRVDLVDKECLEKAYSAGCRKIYYGIESVSSDVLGNISKGIKVKQIKEAIALTHDSGISPLGFFMVGNPGDTKESILATIDFAKSLKLDYIQVCRTIAKPNTELNDTLIRMTGRDYWREYISGKFVEARFPTPWTGLSDKELEYYVRKFYDDFYFRPSYILKRLRKSKSINELSRYIMTAVKWFFCNIPDAGRYGSV